jgi:hypothetical protein
LPAVGAIVDPLARRRNPLTGGDDCSVLAKAIAPMLRE